MIIYVLFTLIGKFIGVKPQWYFGQFYIENLYCTVNRIILNIYRCVISKKYTGQDHYSSLQYHRCRLEIEGDQVLIPVEQLYLNLTMLIGSDSWKQSAPCCKGNISMSCPASSHKSCKLTVHIILWVAAYSRWLPRMLKVAGSVPGRGSTYLYCARGAQGVLPMRAGSATSQLDLPSLTPLSVAGCGAPLGWQMDSKVCPIVTTSLLLLLHFSDKWLLLCKYERVIDDWRAQLKPQLARHCCLTISIGCE